MTTEKEFEQRVFQLHNEYRTRLGLKPFKWSNSLHNAADYFAAEMAEGRHPFGHGNWAKRIGRFLGRRRSRGLELAENIAYGQDTAEEVVRQWIRSPGHKRNMQDRSLRKIGVGYEKRGDKTFWVVDFGTF